MKKLAKFFGYLFFSAAVVVLVALVWLETTHAKTGSLPELKNGDLVFQSGLDAQAVAVSFASISPYTHMGFIKIGADKKPIVVEAVGPVKETPIEEWIAHGTKGRIAIMRIKGLTEEQAQSALDEAKKLYGLPYDFYFLNDDSQIYCSELVHDVFLRGANISLGKVQKVGELNTDNFAVRKIIQKRWQSYPPCDGVSNYDECYKVIMDQELVTPGSVAEDEKLELIYSNYGKLVTK